MNVKVIRLILEVAKYIITLILGAIGGQVIL